MTATPFLQIEGTTMPVAKPFVAATVSRLFGVALALACLAMPATAGSLLQDHALNTAPWSWGFWGKVGVSDHKEDGQSFKRVVISPAPANAWDTGIYITLQKPVKKGDVIVLAMRVRASKLADGNDFAPLTARVYPKDTTDVSVVAESSFMAGGQWKLFLASGKADKDYEPGLLSGGILIGSGEQTLDVAEVIVAGFPPDFDASTLPVD
jgi:hypothetical protein